MLLISHSEHFSCIPHIQICYIFIWMQFYIFLRLILRLPHLPQNYLDVCCLISTFRQFSIDLCYWFLGRLHHGQRIHFVWLKFFWTCYDLSYDLVLTSSWMFHGYLKKICILLWLGEVFCICQLDPAVWLHCSNLLYTYWFPI